MKNKNETKTQVQRLAGLHLHVSKNPRLMLILMLTTPFYAFFFIFSKMLFFAPKYRKKLLADQSAEQC